MDSANYTPEELHELRRFTLRYLGCTVMSLLLTAAVVLLIVRVRVGGILLPWRSILYFCLFTTFGGYQQDHARLYPGSSVTLLSVLRFYMPVTMVVMLAYLIYVAISTVWWVALIAFAAGMLIAGLGPADKVLGLISLRYAEPMLSMVGFVGLPVSAYLMFRHVP